MIFSLLASGFRLSDGRDPGLIRGILWAVLEGFFAAAIYFLLYFLLNAIFTNTLTMTAWIVYSAAILLCLILRIATSFIGLPIIFSGAFAMMGEARLRLVDHLRKIPMGWFGRNRSGDISARLTSDIGVIEQIWSHTIGPFVTGIAMPLFLILFLFFIDWRLSLILLAGLPLAALVFVAVQNIVSKAGVRLHRANSQLQSTLLEYIRGIAVIRLNGRFGMIWQQLEQALGEHREASMAIEAKPAPLLVAFGFLLEMTYMAVVMAGAWFLSRGSLSAPTLLIFLVLAMPAYRQLFDVGLSLVLLRFADRSLERIENIINEPLMSEPVNPKIPASHEIVFNNVSFRYENDEGSRLALEDINCHLSAGKLTAIVGSSGAGKSSFVHLIARLWDVERGSIQIGGVDVREIGTDLLHQRIAMVFQDVTLFSGTVAENLRIGKPDASQQEIEAAAKRAQAHEFIMKLPQGYDTALGESGGSLSGGERQRLSIARALLKDAPILLLDEATASVDPSSEAAIQRALNELTRGRSVVVIAHKFKNIRHADKILVLEKGRLVEEGRHEDLVRHGGLYASMWAAQSSI